ncbi:MAG: DPP IV N-terminal domain-containing protein, partial [marine benthic group bacterium]|nr:DPP IV N-terminal domain-containing protein [Gemmatimonadota bacterium]
MSIDRLAGVVLAASLVLTITLACGDGDGDGGGSTGPDPTGSIEVTLTVAGDAPDADGCVFSVDGASQRRILSGESTTYTGLTVGQHEVAISDVAGNCQVIGDATRSVSVAADQTAAVTYAVSCAQEVGSIDISVSTDGEDQDADGYEIVVDAGAPSAIGINGSMTVGGLTPGDHTVALGDVASNCSVAGGNPRTVTVVAGQAASAAFAVTCSSTSGSVRVSASTGGEDLDEDGYEVVIDGGAPSAIGIDGTMTAGGLTPGDYSIELRGEAFNCFVGGDNPRTVTVAAGQETQVTFDVNCRYHLYNRIAFVSNRTGDYVIHAVEPRAGAPVRSLGLRGSTPAVSPDGLRIAYERDTNIFVANSDGTGETRLTNTGDEERFPAWSPDGAVIAYARWAPSPEIWLMNADGSSQRSL